VKWKYWSQYVEYYPKSVNGFINKVSFSTASCPLFQLLSFLSSSFWECIKIRVFIAVQVFPVFCKKIPLLNYYYYYYYYYYYCCCCFKHNTHFHFYFTILEAEHEKNFWGKNKKKNQTKLEIRSKWDLFYYI
jgi:hypothetical protein